MHQTVSIDMEKDLLEANRKLAEENHKKLRGMGVFSIDVLGSIGSGKTRLIERMILDLTEMGRPCGAILGDVTGDDDYRRICGLNVPAFNLNTGKECHLDAHLTGHAISDMELENIDVLFIENVGNLVCPADFPLGTDRRIVVISVTEGDDMIRKHPLIFREADIIVVNKKDLADIMEVDIDRIVSDAKRIRPDSPVILTDARKGEGIGELIDALNIPRS